LNPFELAFGIVLVVILIGLALYFAWRQVQTMRQLRGQSEVTDEDRRYYRAQAWRRLTGCLLMLVLAGVLIGSYFLEPEYRRITEDRDKATPIKAEDQDFLRQFTVYWVVALALVFFFVVFAMLDLLATLKYGIRKQRQLRTEHRAALEAEVRRIRQQRNGQH
jgi:hypothetical protein